MPTSVNVNEPQIGPEASPRAGQKLSPRGRTRSLAGGGTGAVIAVLIAVGLVFLASEVAGAIHRSSPVGSVELRWEDVAQFFVAP